MSEVITLTEKDFALLNGALDALTRGRDQIQNMLFDVMTEKLVGHDKGLLEDMKRQKRLHDESEKRKHELIIEDVRLLQAKLIQLKRELIAKANLSATDSIINYVK